MRSSGDSSVSDPEAKGGTFATTHWSLVLAAGQIGSTRAMQALERLCAEYWYPLYAYVRRKGHSSADAQDLVQDFFARLLELNYLRQADPNRGRFRTFLLTSLQRFLINEWQKGTRQKRGGGQPLVSLDEVLAEGRLAREPASDRTPDSVYDRGWATVLLERALSALREEFARAGKLEQYDRLKGFVWGEQNALPYAVMARELGMSEGAVKVAVHRMRQRYGELLRAEIAQTVTTPVELEEELRYLASVIRGG